MRKLVVFEHLDNKSTLEAEFDIVEENGHWRASIARLGDKGANVNAPVFYGTTPDQAQRQLVKVFEKEYELVSQKEITA